MAQALLQHARAMLMCACNGHLAFYTFGECGDASPVLGASPFRHSCTPSLDTIGHGGHVAAPASARASVELRVVLRALYTHM